LFLVRCAFELAFEARRLVAFGVAQVILGPNGHSIGVGIVVVSILTEAHGLQIDTNTSQVLRELFVHMK
jgi:hypothetical protein